MGFWSSLDFYLSFQFFQLKKHQDKLHAVSREGNHHESAWAKFTALQPKPNSIASWKVLEAQGHERPPQGEVWPRLPLNSGSKKGKLDKRRKLLAPRAGEPE